MTSPENVLTLDEAVEEVLGMLTGLDLTYDPDLDRYRVIARMLNRALRANALEHEWSYYASLMRIGVAQPDTNSFVLAPEWRARIINDDAARLVDDKGSPVVWAYFLPRDALHKYRWRQGLWCAATTGAITFSRPFYESEDGLDVQIPVMREPTRFVLPPAPESPNDPIVTLPQEIRDLPVDFNYPDVITARAAYMYSLTDPVMQPRAQTLESVYKDLMYQAIERDDRMTDSPFENEFLVPVQNSIYPESPYRPYPLSDRRL